jgi:hypothetical protein
MLDVPPAPGERPFGSLADIAVGTLAVGRAAAALQMVAGLGVRPQQLTPEGLEALAKAAGGESAKASLDPASIDTGVLARTVLVARLLSGQPAPLSVLPHEALDKFKKDFSSGSKLVENAANQATSVLRQAGGSSPLEGPAQQVAARWIAGLCPLGPLLGHPKT